MAMGLIFAQRHSNIQSVSEFLLEIDSFDRALRENFSRIKIHAHFHYQRANVKPILVLDVELVIFCDSFLLFVACVFSKDTLHSFKSIFVCKVERFPGGLATGSAVFEIRV